MVLFFTMLSRQSLQCCLLWLYIHSSCKIWHSWRLDLVMWCSSSYFMLRLHEASMATGGWIIFSAFAFDGKMISNGRSIFPCSDNLRIICMASLWYCIKIRDGIVNHHNWMFKCNCISFCCCVLSKTGPLFWSGGTTSLTELSEWNMIGSLQYADIGMLSWQRGGCYRPD